MTADMVMKALAGLLLVALVGIPVAVWTLVVVAGLNRAAARVRDSYADAHEDRRRQSESRVSTPTEVLADLPDVGTSGALRHPVGRWTGATPLDDQPAEVIAAMVAGAHQRPL